MAMQSQVSPTPYLPVIHLKQKIPLLQLQFEGILNVSNLLFWIKIFIYSDPRICPKISTKSLSSKRPWYNKKRYLIPISLLVIIYSLTSVLDCVLISKFRRTSKLYQTVLNSEVSDTPCCRLWLLELTFFYAPHPSLSHWCGQYTFGKKIAYLINLSLSNIHWKKWYSIDAFILSVTLVELLWGKGLADVRTTTTIWYRVELT